VLAWYLPQFHPVPENNAWWGAGFTEWRNVVRATPGYKGHYQPQLPADLGFYDLRVPETQEDQAALARKYGIHGFAYHYYWFNGHRLLERPVERFLDTIHIARPFPSSTCTHCHSTVTPRFEAVRRAYATAAGADRPARVVRTDGAVRIRLTAAGSEGSQFHEGRWQSIAAAPTVTPPTATTTTSTASSGPAAP
jgi:hypothetical protein